MKLLKQTVIFIGILSCFSHTANSEEFTDFGAGFYFRMPLYGGIGSSDNQKSFRYGFALNARKETQFGVRYYDREIHDLNLLNLQFTSDGTQKLSLSGSEIMSRKIILHADGTVGKETTFSNSNLGIGLLAAGAIAGAVVLATGGDDTADACIAIFPKPPGCP